MNHANATTAIDFVSDMLKLNETKGEKVKASMIRILCYYQGQARLLRDMIKTTDWSPEDKKAIEVSTVDSYQGKEARIVIVDTVAARAKMFALTWLDQDAPDDAEDFGGEDYIKAGQVTGHVKNPHRLNVALTRGKDCTVVLGQEALLVATGKVNRGKVPNSLANMVIDARIRDCLITSDVEDMHEDSITARLEVSPEVLDQKRKTQWNRDFRFIHASRTRYQQQRHLSSLDPEAQRPVYRTPHGDTTRPIGNPKLVAAADAHDVKVAAETRLALELSKKTSEEGGNIQKAKENSLLDTRDPVQFPPLAKGKEVAPPDTARDEVMKDVEAEKPEPEKTEAEQEIEGGTLISDDKEEEGHGGEVGHIAAGAWEPKDKIFERQYGI